MKRTCAVLAGAVLASLSLNLPVRAEPTLEPPPPPDASTNTAPAGVTNAVATNASAATSAPVAAVRVDAVPTNVAPAVAATNALAPAIACEASSYDFGESDGVQPLKHIYVLKNAGTAPLQLLNVRAGCGCATTAMSTNLLAPGETAELAVSITIKGGKGRQRRTLYVESNDPRTPRFRLEALATIQPYVEVQPEGVFFGAVGTNDVPESDVVVSGRTNVVFHVTRVNTGSPLFSAQVVTNEEGRSYRVKILALAPRPTGSSRASVEIYTDQTSAPCLTVPVTIFVPSDLMVMPSALIVFGTLQGRSQYIHVYSPAQKTFNIVRIQSPDPAMDIKAETEGEGRYRLVVKYDGPPENLAGKEIHVATDMEGAKDLVIPIRIIPRRAPAPPARK